MRGWFCLAALALAAPTGVLAAPAKPLFASDDPIRVTIQGPITSLAAKRSGPAQAATLSIAGGGTFPITLQTRGITRLRKDVCAFPELRVTFTQAPAAGSLFKGQRRLKLYTHCRNSVDYQQKILLEYSAYKIYNLLTPQSFRVRLAQIDYRDPDGKPLVSRVGYFLEEFDDVAKRNDMRVAHMGPLVPLEQIDPVSGARMAIFEYLISNYDWSMRAGPQGEECCHNGRLMSSTGAGVLTVVPYDFDFSGLVDAPYAGPPDGIPIRTIRDRNYRGYCAHMTAARPIAAQVAARRGEILGVFGTIPGMDPRTSQKATAFVGGFFADVDSGKIFKSCVR